MPASGENLKEAIRPDLNRDIMIDFQGATIYSETGFTPLREIDDRFKIVNPMKDCLEDLRCPNIQDTSWCRWFVKGSIR